MNLNEEDKKKLLEALGGSEPAGNKVVPEKMYLEITHDPADLREILWNIIIELRSVCASRPVSIAITKLEEARFWLGEELYGVPHTIREENRRLDEEMKRGQIYTEP